MTVSLWLDRSATAPPRRCEVLIVGAGIAGASAAYWLTARGVKPVVLEARQPAAGATGRNAGFVLLGVASSYASACGTLGRGRARALWEFTRENQRLLQTEVLGRVACDADWPGSCRAAVDGEEAAELEASLALLRQDGFRAELLAADAVNQALSSRGLRAGLYQAEDGVLDPVLLTRGLLDLACAAGAELLSGEEVHAIEPLGDRVQVRSHSGCFHAEQVLVCTNAWAPQLLPWLEPWVVPVRGQVLALDGTRGRLRWPVYADHGYAYVRQVGDGRAVAGGMRHRFVDQEVGYGDATTAGLQSAIEAFVADYFPGLAGSRVTHRWSGTMALSPDGVPLLARAPEEPRLTFVGGFSGHGLGFAFHLAKLAVAHSVDGAATAPFELTRFEAGQ